MRITAVRVTPLTIPNEGPNGSISGAVVQARTDDGLEGLGHALPFSAARQFRTLVAAIEEMSELLIGEDPTRPERIHRKLMPGPIHLGGVGHIAASALDIAVWDLAGKIADLPLYRLLGGHRDRVPAYASLRLRREYPLADLPGIASALVEEGHRAIKMNLGGESDVRAEVERVKAVRQAIGPDVRLLADANFRWVPSHAIRVGRAVEEFGLQWLEDPVPTHDVAGLVEVRRALNVPIANGEALTTLVSFRPLFEAGAVDYPMPDLARVGGITPFLKIAHLAEAFSLPIACHLLPEISAQVLAAVPNGFIAEHVPWAWRIFQGCPDLVDGELVMSDRPGHGLALDEAALKQYAVG